MERSAENALADARRRRIENVAFFTADSVRTFRGPDYRETEGGVC